MQQWIHGLLCAAVHDSRTNLAVKFRILVISTWFDALTLFNDNSHQYKFWKTVGTLFMVDPLINIIFRVLIGLIKIEGTMKNISKYQSYEENWTEGFQNQQSIGKLREFNIFDNKHSDFFFQLA